MPKKKAAEAASSDTKHAVEQTGNPGEPEVYWFDAAARERHQARASK